MSKHPIFSENMDDSFSLFFLAFSKSPRWLTLGVLALFGMGVLFSIPIEKNSIVEKLLIALSLTGILFTWIAAQANAYSKKKRSWLVAIFVVWPLAYWYLLRELYREIT